MPLSGFQFGKQAAPAAAPTPAPSMGSRMGPIGATPLPNAPRPMPGATLSATPLPNFKPKSGMGKIRNL